MLEILKMPSKRADLVFDVYVSPSIKDIENKDRGDYETFEVFSIDTKQKIERNINDLMSYTNFKNELLNFLYKEYQDLFYTVLIGDKEFFFSVKNHCMKLCCVDQKFKWVEKPSLFGEHLEAVAGVMFFGKHANVKGAKNIVVSGNDTDISIIRLTSVQHLKVRTFGMILV